MRKWQLMLVVGAILAFPTFASAQTDLTLSSVSVQLWPEYDQPSMLVIVDFQVADAQLPSKINFRIPGDANLIAVAAHAADGGLVNAVFEGPSEAGELKTFTITMDSTDSYRFEYYEPISFNGNTRSFSYLWDGLYAVDAFDIRVLEPIDVVSLSTQPELPAVSEEAGLKYYSGDPKSLSSGQQFTLNLNYEKTTDTLIAPPQGLQPSVPVDENTPGRVSLNNSLPYVIGGLGVILIVGGFVYYWQSGRPQAGKPRRRSRASHSETGEDETETYCPQCGTRATSGDRFCPGVRRPIKTPRGLIGLPA